MSLNITNNQDEIIKEIIEAPLIIFNNIESKILNKFTSNTLGCDVNIKPSNTLFGNKFRSNGKLNMVSISIFKIGQDLDKKYLYGLNSILSTFSQSYPNFVLRIYYDSSISSDRYFNDIKLKLKLKDYIQFAKYDCPYQKNDKHVNLFGALSRFCYR